MIFQETWDKYCGKMAGTGGRADYAKNLYDYADALPANSIILEVGTFLGGSAICMISALQNRNGHIYTIDPAMLSNEEIQLNKERISNSEVLFAGSSTYDGVKKTMDNTPFKDNITLLPGFSEDIYKKWDKGCIIDLLYIDGCHTYEAVKKDMEWVNYLKSGGLLVMDDWIEPVEHAMQEWNASHGNILHDVEKEHNTWPIRFRKG